MRKLAVLLVLALLAPAGAASAAVDQAGSLLAYGQFAQVERDQRGGVWGFEQQRADQQLSLARLSREGAGNDIGRAFVDRSAGLAYDGAADVLWYDAAGVIHRRHEVEGTSTTDVAVTTVAAPTGLDVGPDGALYVADRTSVRRVTADGATSTVVADLDGITDVAAAPDGSLLVLVGGTLWRVRGGVRTAIADLGGATVLDTASDGTTYVGDSSTVRVVAADGTARVVAGDGRRCADVVAGGRSCGVGGPATSASLDPVTSLTVSDTDLFFVTRAPGALGRLFRVPDVAAAVPVGQGYRFVASDGGLFAYGGARFHGSMGGRPLAQPIVGGAAHGSAGYWLVARDGGVFAFGDAPFRGSAAGFTTTPVVGLVAAGGSGGYVVLEQSGRLHAFGTAPTEPPADVGRAVGLAMLGGRSVVAGADGRVSTLGRSTPPPTGLRSSVTGIAVPPDQQGWWLVGTDGRVYPHGSAGDYGSMAGRVLRAPIVGMTPTPTGRGYWLLGADGGVFSFGDARFLGSTGNLRLNRPVVALL